MNRDIELDVLLRGRKFKRLVDDLYRDFRDRYGLKQAEVDVLVFLCEFPEFRCPYPDGVFRGLPRNELYLKVPVFHIS